MCILEKSDLLAWPIAAIKVIQSVNTSELGGTLVLLKQCSQQIWVLVELLLVFVALQRSSAKVLPSCMLHQKIKLQALVCDVFVAAFLIVSFVFPHRFGCCNYDFGLLWVLVLVFFFKKRVCVWNVQSAVFLQKETVWFLRTWNRNVIWTEKNRYCVFCTFLRYALFKKVLAETRRQAINQLKTWVKMAVLYIASITFPWMS